VDLSLRTCKLSESRGVAQPISPSSPLSLNSLDPSTLPTRWEGVFSDIDDTLTHHGEMIPQAFDALARLRAQGLKVILVTGRPAGWVDHIARMWPVDGVVGENGGLWFYMHQGRLKQSYLTGIEVRTERRHRLDQLAHKILRAVPGSALASDQPFRMLDLAIDFCEDVPPLSNASVDRIVELFEEAGAQAKISSIHVNGWFGAWDKLTGCQHLLREAWDIDLDAQRTSWLYFGDSANDEPMFEAFSNSVGVENIKNFLPKMLHHPRWITERPGGYGFVEGVTRLVPKAFD
jgi:HAD superfamily hydrolase (TIGR01484 family)